MDDDIFNTITGGDSVQPVINNQAKQNIQVDNDPYGLLSLNVSNNQPTNNQFNPVSTNVGGFDMNLLGFGTTSQPQN